MSKSKNFKILNIYYGDKFSQVVTRRTNKKGVEQFFIYVDDKWKWVNADKCVPEFSINWYRPMLG